MCTPKRGVNKMTMCNLPPKDVTMPPKDVTMPPKGPLKEGDGVVVEEEKSSKNAQNAKIQTDADEHRSKSETSDDIEPMDTSEKETSKSEKKSEPEKIYVPVPIPFFIPFPVPIVRYSLPVPYPVFLPALLPTPIIVPTNAKDSEELDRMIAEIKEKFCDKEESSKENELDIPSKFVALQKLDETLERYPLGSSSTVKGKGIDISTGLLALEYHFSKQNISELPDFSKVLAPQLDELLVKFVKEIRKPDGSKFLPGRLL